MDLNKIRQRLDTLNKQNKPSGSKLIWKPEPGSQVVRIVPNMHDRDWPFMELYFYYDLAKRTIISPQNFGEADPVQELVDKLKSTGEREDFLLARKLEPRMRTYVPIIVRGKENEGVKFWGFGKSVYEELLKTIDDPDYGDITDLKTGTDITIEYEKATKPGEYPKTSFRVKRSSSPATTDPAIAQLIKEMPTVRDVWEPPTYDELAEILDKFINNSEEEEAEIITADNESDDFEDLGNADIFAQRLAEETETPAKKTGAKNLKATSDIDAAFDEMFK